MTCNTMVSVILKILYNGVYLYTLIGWSMLAPIVLTILLSPLNFWIISLLAKYSVSIL